MMLVGQLKVDVYILCLQSIPQPQHHVGDLVLVDVVALMREPPGQCEVPQAQELPQDVDEFWEVHLTAPDRERDR